MILMDIFRRMKKIKMIQHMVLMDAFQLMIPVMFYIWEVIYVNGVVHIVEWKIGMVIPILKKIKIIIYFITISRIVKIIAGYLTKETKMELMIIKTVDLYVRQREPVI